MKPIYFSSRKKIKTIKSNLNSVPSFNGTDVASMFAHF